MQNNIIYKKFLENLQKGLFNYLEIMAAYL